MKNQRNIIELESKIKKFFKNSRNLKTVNNLIVDLGMTKEQFKSHQCIDEEYRELLISAEERCEAWLIENGLINTRSGNFTQFLLKHNHGYTDQKEEAEDVFKVEEIKIVRV